MKIKIERVVTEDKELVFTVTCSEPSKCKLDANCIEVLRALDASKKELMPKILYNPSLQNSITDSFHAFKQKEFEKVLSALKFNIENSFRKRMDYMTQEMFNWITDNQSEELLLWMMEFNPVKTKYYFDNDAGRGRDCANADVEEDDDYDEDDLDDGVGDDSICDYEG